MRDLFSNLQKYSNRLIFITDFLFCTLSLLICHFMNCSVPSFIIAVFLWIIAQAFIAWILFDYEGRTEFLRRNWFALLIGTFSLLLIYKALIRLYTVNGIAGFYTHLGSILCISMIYLTATVMLYSMVNEWSYEKMFVPQAAVFGAALSLLFPLYSIADEPQHMRTAYNLSNTMMGIRSPEDSVMMRRDDADYDFSYSTYDLDDFNRYLEQISKPLEDEALIAVYDDSTADPHTIDYARRPYVFDTEQYQYLAPAAGISLGRILKLNTISMYLLGRLFNLLFYIAAIYFSLKLLPVGKSLLYTISLFPISLQLAGSMSRDVFRISSAVLTVALTLYIFYTEDNAIKHKKTAVGALIITAAVLLPLRSFVYSLISLLPLFIYAYRKRWITDRMLKIFVIICISLFVLALFVKYFFFPGNIVEEPQIMLSWTTEMRYTKEYFINHPLHIFSILINTLSYRGDYYIKTMIGYQLGWLDLSIPDLLCNTLLILMAVSTFHRSYEKTHLPYLLRFTLFAFSCIGIALIILGLTLTWTPVTSPVAEGVQGRYFLPLLLPLLLSFRGNAVTADKKCDLYCMCIQFVALISTTSFMLSRFL